MRPKLVLAAFALLVGLVAVFFPAHRDASPSPAPTSPITLLYIPDYDADGSPADNPSFWVTNHTAGTLSIQLKAIENRAGSAWVQSFSFPFGLLYFNTPWGRTALLGPYEAFYGEMLAQRVLLPTNTVWRVRASVSERLVGAATIAAAVSREPGMLALRVRTGDTNIPLNPFGKDVSRFAHPSSVVSQEVLLQSLANQSSARQLATTPDTPPFAARPEDIAKAREGLRLKMSDVVVEQPTDQPAAAAPK